MFPRPFAPFQALPHPDRSHKAARCGKNCERRAGRRAQGGRTRGPFALSPGMEHGLRTHRELADLAARQYGVVSHQQLEGLGYSRTTIARAASTGRLHAVHKTVFAVGHGGLSRSGKCFAAVLARGEGALLSYRSAAWLWGIEAVLELPIEVSVRWRGHSRDRLLLHHCPALREEDRAEVERIPVTAIPRTLLDLASVVKLRRLERALDRTERLDLLDLDAIDKLLGEVRHHPGGRNLRRAIEVHREPGFARSRGEKRFLQLLREAGLPRPHLNTWVEGYEVDLYFEREQFAVELDSWDAHRSRRSFEEDPQRHENLKLAGIEMIRITGTRLAREPDQITERLGILLRRRREELAERTYAASIRRPTADRSHSEVDTGT
jgi:very-short-patch-repair endonuclease